MAEYVAPTTPDASPAIKKAAIARLQGKQPLTVPKQKNQVTVSAPPVKY